ncbi:unnamed protein product [Parnassius apollo]|uniref:(apollo) hypothetical protein n=1 Tax=Parnassius apollo TaxID=110799 RepID=A0A8S3Y9Y8_PARAO|nr:unnamed protein product [Parnassius apollo]
MTASETPEQYEARLTKQRERYTQMIASETPEEYEARLTKQRERYTQMVASETPEEYEVRLIQSRERQRQQLSSETPEHRDTRNNPLYKDVRIDDNAQISDQELVRLSVPELSEDEASERNENEIRNAFIPINNVARIIRASWHQGDYNVFTSRYAGVQCSAMSLANIVRAAILSPNQWDVNILNANMLAGDSLYYWIRTQLDPTELDETGYLEIRNFHIVRQSLQMYECRFSIEYDEDTLLFGSLQDSRQINLLAYFTVKTNTILLTPILVAQKGKPTPENGKACVIECENLQELCRICKRCLGSRNIAYTLTRVDLHLRENIITRQGVQVQQQEDAITHQDVQVQQPLSNLRSETIPIQTSVMLPIDSVQPDVEDELEVSENVNEIRRKTNNNIVNEAYELKAEEFAWYQLFPYGKNGLKEQRPVNISPLDYYQFRLLVADVRFQRNDYLFYALSMFDYYRVKSTIAACARKVEGENGNRVEDLHLYLKNLRGSAAYWRSALSDLIAQIRCLGPPTYFLTLSCNDLH